MLSRRKMMSMVSFGTLGLVVSKCLARFRVKEEKCPKNQLYPLQTTSKYDRREKEIVFEMLNEERMLHSPYVNGKYIPARKYRDGTNMYCKDGLFHRSDGPAIEYANGNKEWWVNGEFKYSTSATKEIIF